MVRFYRKFFQHQYPGVVMWLVITGVWARFALVASVKAYRNCAQGGALKKNLRQQTATLQMADRPKQNSEKRILRSVAVVGASSMVGQVLLPLLARDGAQVVAYSRKPEIFRQQNDNDIEWREMSTLFDAAGAEAIREWVWLAPIRALPEHLAGMQRAGARHIVALSTTSRYTKLDSSSAAERKFVEELIAAEEKLQAWAEGNAAAWTILRPTLIYGLGLDKNVGVIARFIRRFRFFPVLGEAGGLRQPIHARDVAAACKAALECPNAVNHAYNISGAERLSYRMMVVRIFEALSIRPRFLSIPLWMFAAGVAVLRMLPPFRSWSAAMAERMNQDMVFDHEDAVRDLGFSPQPFRLDAADLRPASKQA
jgi:nucleoside-diphosphate-sugar epimerase